MILLCKRFEVDKQPTCGDKTGNQAEATISLTRGYHLDYQVINLNQICEVDK